MMKFIFSIGLFLFIVNALNAKEINSVLEEENCGYYLQDIILTSDTSTLLHAVASLEVCDSCLPVKVLEYKDSFGRLVSINLLSVEEQKLILCKLSKHIKSLGANERQEALNLLMDWCNTSSLLFNAWKYGAASNEAVLFEINSLKPIIQKVIDLKVRYENGVAYQRSLEDISSGEAASIRFSVCNYVTRLPDEQRLKIYEEYFKVLRKKIILPASNKK